MGYRVGLEGKEKKCAKLSWMEREGSADLRRVGKVSMAKICTEISNNKLQVKLSGVTDG